MRRYFGQATFCLLHNRFSLHRRQFGEGEFVSLKSNLASLFSEQDEQDLQDGEELAERGEEHGTFAAVTGYNFGAVFPS